MIRKKLPEIKGTLIAILLLLLLTIAYFPEAFFFNGVLSFRDLGRYFYPLRMFTVEVMKTGIIPLWNPYISCGVPHLALQQSVIFYPLSIIYYIMPYDIAFNVFLVFHIFLAGVFTFMLAKRWGLKDPAAILAALMFMFSGYLISVINLATTLSSVIWLPLIIFFLDKALCEKSISQASLAGLSLGIMFLGGEPSIFYSALWVLFFYSIFYFANEKKIGIKKVAIIFLAMVLIGIGISCVQLIPFIELMRMADRTISAASYNDLTNWSLPLKDTIGLIIPFLTRTDFSKESYLKEQNWVVLIYMGALSALLLALSLAMKKNWRTKFLYFIGILFLLVSYGRYTPFYYFLYKFIPGFNVIRYPVRFFYITTFAIALISGMAFDAYLSDREKASRYLEKVFKYMLPVIFLLSVIFLGLNIYNNELINAGLEFCRARLDPEKNAGVLYGFIAGLMNIKRFIGFLMAGSMVLFLGMKMKLRREVVVFAFLSIMVADIFSASPGAQPVLDSGTMRAGTKNMDFLKKDKALFRFFPSPKLRQVDRFAEGKTYEEAILNGKDRLSEDWPMIHGLYDASGYDSIYLLGHSKIMCTLDTALPSDTKILEMLNVKYVAVPEKINISGYRLASEGTALLYENRNVLERAFIVPSFRVINSETDIASMLKSREFDPRKEVILEEDPVEGNRAMASGITAAGERVEITKYSPNEVLIDAAVGAAKFLILADSYYPGWKAYVDGRLQKIYKANFILRGVYLRPGEHKVRFLFDPFSFRLGALISILSLGIVGALCLVDRRKG